MKYPVLKTKDYILYFEYILVEGFKEVIIAHCDVFKWNKEVKKELVNRFFKVFQVQDLPIYVIVGKENTKLFKFARMNGFLPYKQNVTIANGETKDMLKWIGSK